MFLGIMGSMLLGSVTYAFCRHPELPRCVQVREQEVGGVCNQSALLMQQLPEASPFRTLSAAGAFA